MDFFSKAMSSFGSQEPIGWIVIGAIGIVLLIGIIANAMISKKYIGLSKKFKKCDGEISKEKPQDFDDETLNKIVSEFINSAKNGTENINTEVIIQKNLGKITTNTEKLMKILPAICIAFGLLGTFIGLTLAIGESNAVLDGLSSMEEFAEKMKNPFASMSSAFWTSICGVFFSVILNCINGLVENSRENFYDIIEDYLDNNIYALYYVSPFDVFNNVIKDTMIGLTKDMRSLFQDGVNELVGKINKNTLDLTGTVKELTNYTKDLDRLTQSLNTSVENFKEPVEKFKVSIYEFTSITEDLSLNMKESVNKFAAKVDVLDNNLTNLYDSVDGNNSEIANISMVLKNQADRLNDSYNRVLELINSVSGIQTSNTEALKEQIEKLNEGYNNFDNGLVQFGSNLELLQNKIADGISQTLNKEMEYLTNNIVDKLSLSSKDVMSSAEQLTKNTIAIGEVVKASNDLWATVNRENS